MAKAVPIDPAGSPQWALAGRIVTLDSDSTVVPDGVVWIKDAVIVAVTPRGERAPDGFEEVTPVESGGTIFPGLIDLHNHVAYDALPLWQVPTQYTNRNTWGNSDDYHRLVTAPMKTIGEATELLPALVRYVEAKALVGGVTTTQGIALFSAPGIRHYYKGIVRNAEQTGDRAGLPEAGSRIADVDARDAQKFLTQIEKKQCYLLHLSEGTDDAAHKHFEALALNGDHWAIAHSLAGIHCVALTRTDFDVLAARGASMVWSPLSNLLLYGQTANVAAAKAAGSSQLRLKIGLGSDWSPSGSKSLFGELKVARLYSKHNHNVFSDKQLARLGTSNGAQILDWQDEVGSIEPTKRADLLAVAGQDDHNPYVPLFTGDERSIQLVVINGTPRYGTPNLMSAENPDTEQLTVGDQPRLLYLKQQTEDPHVAALSYGQARAALKAALENIKELRLEQEAHHASAVLGGAPHVTHGHPRLALDEFEKTNFTQRPHLALAGQPTGPTDKQTPHPAPVSSLLSPIELDKLTVADDPDFLDRVAAQPNLPPYLAPGLRTLYSS